MSSSSGIVLEIAVHSVESAVAAQRGGADRIELFSNPLEGGVTPSAGLVAVIRDELTLDIHVMIRPRAGDFHYEKAEFAAMKRDILLAKRLGVKGLVFGVLTLAYGAALVLLRVVSLSDLAAVARLLRRRIESPSPPA